MMKATVYSAYPMDADTLESIRPVLEKKFGCELDMKVEVDRTLIGSIRVKVGDTVLDCSVKEKLAQLKTALMG
jgi:F-type H+-transporting ATPase subunit delta